MQHFNPHLCILAFLDHEHIYIPFIIILNLCVYWRTLSYGLVIDDIDWYRKIKSGQCDNRFSPNRSMPWWKVLANKLYGAGTFGLNYRIDHITTLTLHIITAVLISTVFNPIAAILWSVHPCNHQTAIWLTGRRYQILNIAVLMGLVLHFYIIFPILMGGVLHFAYKQLSIRKVRNIPIGQYNLMSILNCIIISTHKLSGLYKPYHLYPYTNVAPYLPHTQICAERYLSIPLIFVCFWLSHIPYSLLLLPFYVHFTWNIQPMYKNIQSFYDYHRINFPTLPKLFLLKKLYPEIKLPFHPLHNPRIHK